MLLNQRASCCRHRGLGDLDDQPREWNRMRDQQDRAFHSSQALSILEPAIKVEIARRNSKLLPLLEDVEVDSKDPMFSLLVKDAEPQKNQSR